MSDTLISTAKVYVNGGGASGYGSVSAPTAGNISDATAAVAAMLSATSTDIDTLIASRVDLYFVPPSFFSANGWSAGESKPWGYTPKRGKHFINNTLNTKDTKYTVLHEIGHSIDPDKLNKAKRVTLAGLMSPSVATGTSGFWGNGSYLNRPSECFADTIPRAYAGITSVLVGSAYNGGFYYQHHVASSDYATFRSTITGAGAPASTTLAAASSIGATNLKVASVTGLSVGDWVYIDSSGSTPEIRQLTAVGTSGSGGTGISFTDALIAAHANSAPLVETAPPSDAVDGAVDDTVTTNTPNASYVSHLFSGLPLGASGTAKLRFFDGQAWGPWSDDVPVSLSVTPGRPTAVTVTPGTLTPTFGATLNTPPGDDDDYITHYHIDVQQNIAGIFTPMMVADVDVDPLTNTKRILIPYNGNVGGALAWDQDYVFIINLTNKYGVTVGMAAYQSFRPTQDTGPLITYSGDALDLSFKIDTQTPTFRLAAQSGADIDEARLTVKDSTQTNILYETSVGPFGATAHKDIAVPSNVLTWGLNPWISGAVRVSGDTDFGATSTPAQVHINAQPGAPAPVSVKSDTAQVIGPGSPLYVALGRSDGLWVISEDTPTLVFPYRDVDRDTLGYDDEPTRREVDLVDESEDDIGSSPYVITSSITDEFDVDTGLLDPDTTFKARADFDDSASVRSAFSDWLLLHYAHPPTIDTITPADGDTVTDPTPSFSWHYSGDRPQAAYQLAADVAGAEVYNTGLVISSSTSAVMPAGLLDTAEDVEWQLDVYDTFGLRATVVRTFTTAFTQPDPVTGLTVTPDPDTDSLIVTYDQSLLPGEEFQAYVLEARPADGQFTVFATIADQTQTTVYFYAAPHNVETIIRVSQTNGWKASDTVDASATLGGDMNTTDFIDGYWLVRPELVTEVKFTRHGPGEPPAQVEQFTIPGRKDRLVVMWGTTGYEGTLQITSRDRGLLDLLRQYRDQATIAIFKTAYGAARYVRILTVPDTDMPAGIFTFTVTYQEVEPAAAGF